MSEVREIGRSFYVQKLYYITKPAPLVDMVATNEIHPPYRTGRALALRVPFTKIALILGRWVDAHRSEQDALLAAMRGRVTQDNAVNLSEVDEW